MSYRAEWLVPIQTRDGVSLAATLYEPWDAGPTPVVLSMTPYTADTYHERGRFFSQHGFRFLTVDVRGRGSSEGQFVPFANEARDGKDIVDWIALQPWCDGNVLMWGGSYAGMAQWFTASKKPVALRGIVPVAPSILGDRLPFARGVYLSYWVQWLTLTTGRTAQWNAAADPSFWFDVYKRMYCEHRAFGTLFDLVGKSSTWKDWISHPALDSYWDGINTSAEGFSNIEIPVLGLTGLFDGALRSTIEYHRRHAANMSSEEARKRHFLLIGPWDHAGTRSPRPTVGGLTLGPGAMIDLDALHVAWYHWVLGTAARPSFLVDRFVYYVTGIEEWRCAPDVDSIARGQLQLYLQSDSDNARDVFASGSLTRDSRQGTGDARYRYDPLDLRPAEILQPEDRVMQSNLLDQTAVMNLLGNGLVYHSAPLEEDIVVAGAPEVRLWITLDVPDTDVKVGLYHVMPDGRALVLGEDYIRARYRESPSKENFAQIGVAYEYVFSGLPFISRRLEKYSRLRLVVACPNSMFVQKNYNSGGDVMWETARDARVANVTVHQSPPHASCIIIPIGELTSERRLDDALVASWCSTQDGTTSRPN